MRDNDVTGQKEGPAHVWPGGHVSTQLILKFVFLLFFLLTIIFPIVFVFVLV